MPEIKVSIVVPVYNVEKYLKECMDSLLNQSLKEIEIVCVNDGSTDNSPDMLAEYASKDSRIIIVTKENGGLAAARNDGMKKASGEYILFVDSDDFLDINYCEILYAAAKKYDADMSLGGSKDYYDSGKSRQNKTLKEFPAEEKRKIIINDDNRAYFFSKGYKALVTAWGRLIRRSMLDKYEIRFYKERTSEDIPFTSLNFLYANIITVDESVFYYYRQAVGSSLSKKTDNMVEALLKNLATLYADVKKRGFTDKKILNAVTIAAADVLFGYYDKWNTGNFSKCSLKTIKRLYPAVKNDYIGLFAIKEFVSESDNKIFKLKYKMFSFGLRHNIYIMPKIMRLIRNFLRLFKF